MSSGPTKVLSAPTNNKDAGFGLLARENRRAPSLAEFGEQLECVINENRDLSLQLKSALDEKAVLHQLNEQSHAELDRERAQLNSEIADLRAQLNGRLTSLLAIRENLIRDEFVKKFQELSMEIQQERAKLAKQVEKLKRQRSNCICQ